MPRSRFNACLAAGLAWLTLGSAALAHPHVFMTYNLGLRQQAGQIQGLDMVWTLNEEGTNLILDEYDTNHNGQLESAEAFAIASALQQDMADYNFYSEVRLDAQPVPIHQVQELRASLEQNRIVYRLFLPCKVDLAKGARNLSYKAIDPSNYVAFTPSGQPAQLQGSGPLRMQILQTARQMYEPWTFKLVRP